MNRYQRQIIALIALLMSGAGVPPAHATIQGVLGEAWLVPLVMHAEIGSSPLVEINTIVTVKVPDFAGVDTISNVFTAPHATGPIDPGNPHPGTRRQGMDNFQQTCEKGGVDIECDTVRWFWFDVNSNKRLNGNVVMTPDDLYVFDWKLLSGGSQKNNPGYLVLTTLAGAQGNDANFAMLVNAHLIVSQQPVEEPRNAIALQIPALPMADAADNGSQVPEIGNEVIANNGNPSSTGTPSAVSPITAGIRIATGDGDGHDQTWFSLDLGARDETDNLLVVWLDDNYAALSSANFVVWDENEDICSGSAPLDRELNLIWIEAVSGATTPPSGQSAGSTSSSAWHLGSRLVHANGAERIGDDRDLSVCVPPGVDIRVAEDWWTGTSALVGKHPVEQRGNIQFTVNEGNDRTGLGGGLGTASATGVAFSIEINEAAVNYLAPGSLDNSSGGLVSSSDELRHARVSLGGDQGKSDN